MLKLTEYFSMNILKGSIIFQIEKLEKAGEKKKKERITFLISQD